MNQTPDTYKFGQWMVEPGLNVLSTNGFTRQLEPLAMDVLVCLLQHPGQLVTTENLMNWVWQGRNAEPHMVAKRVSQIRQALGDSAKNPRYIATISKRGYRTVATVERYGHSSTDDVNKTAEQPGPLDFLDYGEVSPDTGPNEAIPSIAVLPFDDFSADPSQQYIADGMTDEIITELSKHKGIRVISRASVMHYQSKEQKTSDIAQELGVSHILLGSIAHEAGLYRVNVQLIDAKSDSLIWASGFEHDGNSGLTMRREIASEVVSQLGPAITQDEPDLPYGFHAVDEIAYDAYLLALSYIGPSERYLDWAPKAIDAINRAVKLDPQFAEAWAQLALIETIKAAWIDREHFKVVREYAEKALSIDRKIAEAHTALGYTWLLYDWNPIAAEREFKKALESNQNQPWALHGYMNNLLVLERTNEAIQLSRKLLSIAPKDISIRIERVQAIYQLRQFDRVLEEISGIRAFDPDFESFAESIALFRLGRFEDSLRARIAAYRSFGPEYDQARMIAEKGLEENDYETVLRELAELGVKEHGRWAYWFYAQLGELDTAFSLLESLIEAHTPWVLSLGSHPDFDVLRLDPRFEELLNRTGLPILTGDPGRLADEGRLMAFRGDAEKAIEMINRAIKTAPDDPRLPRWQESMAWAQFANSDYDRAIYWAQEMLLNSPERHPKAFANLLLASSYSHTGRLDSAKAALSEAQSSWPNAPIRLERDLLPFFIGGHNDIRDRYISGLKEAGFKT